MIRRADLYARLEVRRAHYQWLMAYCAKRLTVQHWAARRKYFRSYFQLVNWTVMYLAHVNFGWSQSEIGRMCGVDQKTVGRVAGLVEDAHEEGDIFDVLAADVSEYARRFGAGPKQAALPLLEARNLSPLDGGES